MMISQKIAALIQDGLERGIDLGSGLEYDVTMIAVPGPGNQPSPMIGLSFTMPSLDLTQGHSAMFIMPPTVPSQDDMDGLVRKVVENLLEVRNQVAAQAQNGHKNLPPNTSPSGLILPGQG